MERELPSFQVTDAVTHDRRKVYKQSDKAKQTETRYKSSPQGKARDMRYTETRRKNYGEIYMSREFVSWDGEGGNRDDGSHAYWLLANSRGDELLNPDGIDTLSALELFLKYSGRKDLIHVFYGGNYDFNMLLKDLDRETLTTLYLKGTCYWKRYRLEWRGGKSFTVSKLNRRVVLYDVLPFFQRTFVAACDEYLGKDWPDRERIIKEKANRSGFDIKNIEEIRRYNRSELETLVNLCTELRERLNKVDLRVNRWDGPGAIASALYRQYGTKQSISPTPKAVSNAARFAYAGGRFEIIRKGHSDNRAYQYDIRSAYPSAMRNLPCLTHGEWRHVIGPTRAVPFGVYRIEVLGTQVTGTRPQPLWHRNAKGTVFFCDNPHGWYWSPEAALGMELPNSVIHEGWEFIPGCECNPFRFVEPLYNKRAALKKAGDGAHIGLKLGLNSLYGKLAQQIGWDVGPPLRLPPFHCLEWAGYVTSHCRAEVYRAAMTAPDDIIAFETDAVFSRVPLDVKLGERLGEWDQTDYSSLTYLKSGMYWGTSEGKEVEKTRGINKGSIPRELVIHELQNGQNKLPATQTRFITLGQALHQNFDLWTHWVTAPREISVLLWGKRIDIFDGRDNHKMTGDGWQETLPALKDGDFTNSYEVAWEMLTEIANEAGMPLSDVRRFDSHLEWESML